MDPYRELGIDRQASTVDIKRAFRSTSRLVHPDAAGGGNRETFDRLTLARDILLDPVARKRFDDTGVAELTPPDQTDQEAMSFIGTVLGLALTQDRDFMREGIDLVFAIRQALEDNRADIAKFIRVGERALQRIERIRGRFKRKTAGDNLLDGSLSWHEEHLTKALESNRKKLRTMERAIEIIGEYEFSPEAAGCMSNTTATTPGIGFAPFAGS